MNARIRFGNELDIARAINPEFQPPKDLKASRVILSFSNRVRSLPDEPEFVEALEHLEIGFQDHGPDQEMEVVEDGITINGNRIVEVQLPVGREQVLKLGKAMVAIGRRRGYLGQDGILFIDHSQDSVGVVLEDFDRLLHEEKKIRLHHSLATDYHLSEAEIEQFFRDFSPEFQPREL